MHIGNAVVINNSEESYSTITDTAHQFVTLFVTFLRRWCVMIVLGKTETSLGVVEFFFSSEEGKAA
jgi:hypothetical protein